MIRFIKLANRFGRDTKGVMIVEAVILLPILIWTFIAFLMIWDGYRAKNLAQKATFAVADIISREQYGIYNSSARNYAKVFAYVAEVPGNINALNFASGPAVVRITSVDFITAANPADPPTLRRNWSLSSHSARLPVHTNASLAAIRDKIPALQGGDNVVLVETILTWEPSFTAAMASGLMSGQNLAWLQTTNIQTMATVRPRFVPKLCVITSSTIGQC